MCIRDSIQAAQPAMSLTPEGREDAEHQLDIPVESPEEALADRISLEAVSYTHLVRILGGCCGTTPAHIAALRKALDALPEGLPIVPAAQISTVSRPEVETDDAFLRKLRSGKKVIAVELDSPKDADLTAYLEGARRLQAAGTDLMTVADCPIARARMDSSLVACRVHRELGLPTLPHMTCRDRNLNATKALLLGLYAEGVREMCIRDRYSTKPAPAGENCRKSCRL